MGLRFCVSSRLPGDDASALSSKEINSQGHVKAWAMLGSLLLRIRIYCHIKRS